MPVSQEDYETLALFSLLKDASNVLLREWVRTAGLVLIETERGGWSDQLCWEYLPRAAEALPLTPESLVPDENHPEYDCVRHPAGRLKETLRVFLEWFVERAVELGAVKAETRRDLGLRHVRVAETITGWNQTGGFRFRR